ncbi:hypothetical protein [Lacrimispora sp. 210928-DFI.3.58]|nr:hypothetical protein [Lacrimispora sp. 210928-DFI.3.58]
MNIMERFLQSQELSKEEWIELLEQQRDSAAVCQLSHEAMNIR